MVYTEYISLWRGEAGEIKKKVFFVQNLSLAEMQGRGGGRGFIQNISVKERPGRGGGHTLTMWDIIRPASILKCFD